jgi:beta-glucanase (GH16 family)
MLHVLTPLRDLAFATLIGAICGVLAGEETAPSTLAPGASQAASALPGGSERWNLVWDEDFTGVDADLDRRWVAQNGANAHILCSRWRENAVMADGLLTITNRKQQRGGQEWTSGSITSKQQFLYGYFECRYRYAAATGTNNAFWLMPSTPVASPQKKFEIDINEGHYPNEIATNIHNWSDVREVRGVKTHPMAPRAFRIGADPEFALTLETPITTRKLRLVDLERRPIPIHLREFRAFAPARASVGTNLIRDPRTRITVSGDINDQAPSATKAADGRLDSEWVSQRDGDKWIQFEFAEDQSLGALEFVSGYLLAGHGQEASGILDQFALQYERDGQWQDLANSTTRTDRLDLSRDFHLYGLEWTADELVFYFDGKELRRVKNEFCHSPAAVWLSLAIIAWAGPVTPAVDGTAMIVDRVRVYEVRPVH